MSNKLPYIIGGSIIAVLVVFLISNSGSNKKLSTVSNSPTPSAKPENIVPGFYPNPIKNTSTEANFIIVSAKVENNTDDNGKPISDHLEITLKNNSGKDLADFEIYYSILDTVNQKKEAYSVKLTGFTLKGGQIETIHFDNKQLANHFEVNTNSLYYTSVNKLLFDIVVSTPSSKVETTQAAKDAGGAETKD